MLAERCRVADTFLSRGVGLIGRASLAQGEGLLLTRTNAITMLFMRFAIDAVFVDRQRRVVRVAAGVRAWAPAVVAPRATEVIELPAGTAARAGVQAGDVLEYEALG